MAKIQIDRAPATALPRRFLLTSPAWGLIAGLLLLVDGDSALQSRWAPATLALTHAFTLGVLGNAMFGSVLQFLPAAAGVRVLGGMRAGWLLHGLLNLGALLLVAGFRHMHPHLMLCAGGLLAAAFALLALMVLPGLVGRSASGLRAVYGPARVAVAVSANSRSDTASMPVAGSSTGGGDCTAAGILFAVLAALVTVVLGAGLLLGLTGHRGLTLLPWVDVHAAWGVLGWCLGLLGSVGAVVMPMFQGTRALPARARFAWVAALGLVLVVGMLGSATGHGAGALRWGAGACTAVFALAGLWLQWRAPRPRNPWLVRAWRAGLLALLGGAGVLAAGGSSVVLGTLVLGIALPWLVMGMQLEIVAFLGWIELHRRCGRGVRLPSVQALMPDSHKAGVFFAHTLAALMLVVAATWPEPAAVRTAGVAMAACHGLLWWRLHGVARQVRAFQVQARRPAIERADAR